MAWNRSDQNSGDSPRKSVGDSPHFLRRGIIAGALVVVLSLLAYFFIINGDSSARPKGDSPRKSTLGSKIPTNAVKAVKSTSETATKAATAPESEPELQTWLGHKVIKRKATTNDDVKIVVETIWTDDGKRHKRFVELKKPVFDNVADEMISMAITTPKGQVMPPMPLFPGFEKKFEEALKKPVKFSEDDTPEIRALKERVRDARESVKEMMASGMSIREILQDHERTWNENVEIRNEAQKLYREALATGDEKLIRKTQIKLDVALQQMGIDPVSRSEDARSGKDHVGQNSEVNVNEEGINQ